MRRVFRRCGYLLAGLFLIGALVGQDDDPNAATAKTEVFDAPSTGSVALPNSKQKIETFAALPQPAGLAKPASPRVRRPAVTAKPAPSFTYVTGTRVNLRTGPSTDNKRLGAFDYGTKLVVLETQNDWSRVSGSLNGTPVSGWMSRKYLNTTKPALRAAVPAPQRKRQIASPSSSDITAARQAIIRQSIANYSGSCPCNYNRDRAGRRCGKRSAWARPGGASPICYESDVTRSHLVAYFRRMGREYP